METTRILFGILVIVFSSCPILGTTDVYVSDSYGNVVYNNGTIRYVRPVPVGNAAYATDVGYDYSSEGMTLLYGFARTFVQDIQPNSFPFDIAEDISNGDFHIKDDYLKIIRHFYGLAACVTIGVACTVMFAIGGCCLCICRCCCGNCGGDRTQRYHRREGCMRMGLTQALVLMTACMLSAAVCVYVTNDRFTDALDFSNHTVATNIDDIDLFLKNTAAELRYLVTDMYDLIHHTIQKDIVNLGVVSSGTIFASLNVDQLVLDISPLNSHIDNINVLLTRTISNIDDLQLRASALKSSLERLADDIEVTAAQCGADCGVTTCDDISTSDIRAGALNTGSLPNLTDIDIRIQALQSINFTAIAFQAYADFGDLANTIDQFSPSIKSAVNSTMMTYYDLIHSLADGVIATMTTAFPADSLKQHSDDIFVSAKDYDVYRRWFGLVLTSVFLVIVSVLILAVVVGVACDDLTALPTERNKGSNLAGNLLLTGVVVMFVVGTLLMIFTVLVFLVGVILEKTCEPLEDLSVFRDFLDANKVSEFSLAKYTLGVTTIDLKGYDVLIGCRANEAPWSALRLGEVIPLESYLKYIDYVGNLGQILQGLEQIDISGLHILTQELSKALDQIQDLGLDQIDFTLIYSVTNAPSLSLDVPSLSATLATFRDSCQDPTKTRWSDHISTLESIASVEANMVNDASVQLNTSAFELSVYVDTITTLTSHILTTATAAEFQIQSNMTGVLLEGSLGVVGRVFSLLDGYVSEVLFLLYDELGNCLPLWNIYQSAVVAVCDYGVDTLNGYWFSTGWGLFFFAPIVVVAVKLSKHYKTMELAKGYQKYEDFMADTRELAPGGDTTVLPGAWPNTSAFGEMHAMEPLGPDKTQ